MRQAGNPADLENHDQLKVRLAPQVDLNTGAARTALRRAILTAQNGDPR
jgi:hypothetical protein